MAQGNVPRHVLLEAARRLPDPLGVAVDAWPPSLSGGDEAAAREAAEMLGFGAKLLEEAVYVALDARELARRRVEREGGYVLPLQEALRELPAARRTAWSLIDPRLDRYTAAVALAEAEELAEGYVVYVPRNVKITIPVYACMLATGRDTKQLLHNIILLEEGAEAAVVTGCAASPAASNALHVGVTEVLLAPGAKLSYTMVHRWGPGSHVRPRTSVHVGRGAEYTSFYVIHGDIASLHSEPRVILEELGRAYLASIAALSSGRARLGSRVELAGHGAAAEIATRIIAKGGAAVEAPLRILARAAARGHVECMALPLSPSARVSTLPILEAETDEAELSHEAAIGKLRGEEIEYLVARGLDEATARRLLLQGLLRIDAPLPPRVKALVQAVERILAENAAA